MMKQQHLDGQGDLPADGDEEPLCEQSLIGFPFGQFMALPLAEQAADGTWRAVVAISGGRRADLSHPEKCAFPQIFLSQHEALKYATDQCELKASKGVASA